MNSNRYFFFKGIFTEAGFIKDAYAKVDAQGRLLEISNQKTEPGLVDYVEGYAIPGFQNAHSHAFQYAMNGLAEWHPIGAKDNFWSWRNAMYSLALKINPDQLEAIAGLLYAEMLRHGYTSVAEFHYLHHDADGKPFSDPTLMSQSLVNAAEKVGIELLLLPVFYQKGGFGQPPTEQQRRFITPTADAYLAFLEQCKTAASAYQNASIGLSFHSLRAVDKESMKTVCETVTDLPIHIHVAEQLKEIEDSVAFYKQRPVEFLLDNFELNRQWNLVHATHLNSEECTGIARSGAQVVICPSTEGNLGDGIFKLREFQAAGGQWCIGSDSHIGLDPKEEIRWLDYGQRLLSHERNTFSNQQSGDSAMNAISMAFFAGRQSVGKPTAHFFEIGQPFNAFVVSADHPLMAATSPEHILNTLVYSADSGFGLGTITHGNWRVKDGKHLKINDLRLDWQKAMKQLNYR